MGASGSIDVVEYPDSVQFTVRTNDAGALIGQNGANLKALNHIVHRITEKFFTDLESAPRFLIDVNDYQKQRTDALNELARMSAQRVRYFKKEVEMHPMTAYERHVIHSALTEYPDITTESVGEGLMRRVVIKPL